jgi:hypothetical protein
MVRVLFRSVVMPFGIAAMPKGALARSGFVLAEPLSQGNERTPYN